MRNDILLRVDEISLWILENKSKAFLCQQLQCKSDTLKRALNKLNIQYDGNKGSRGQKIPKKRKSVEEYLKKTSCIKSHLLKIKILEEGLKKRICEICGGVEWQEQPIPLELDHIDGNHWNWNWDNLRIICPNCHAIQPTNSGKNINRLKNKGLMA